MACRRSTQLCVIAMCQVLDVYYCSKRLKVVFLKVAD